MKNEKLNFVCTTDEQTAKTLRELGYPELPKDGSRWVFVNTQDKKMFSSDDLKVHYTDILTFA